MHNLMNIDALASIFRSIKGSFEMAARDEPLRIAKNRSSTFVLDLRLTFHKKGTWGHNLFFTYQCICNIINNEFDKQMARFVQQIGL